MDYSNRRPKVLLIEDDLTLSNLFTIRMQAEDFEVLAVNEGDKALEMAKQFRPDLVLCDLMMPGISGYDIIDILRNTPETMGSKIAVMSALSEPDDIAKARQLGADDFIVKSQVQLEDMILRLRKLLDLPISETDDTVPAAAA